MKPIEEFPYKDRRLDRDPMHERMLLLQTKTGIGLEFSIGYYDAIHDVFCIIYGQGHLNTEKNPFDERPVSGSRTDQERWKSYGYDSEGRYDGNRSGYWDKFREECHYPGYYCILPRRFTHHVGPRCILGFMTMDEALDEMRDRKLFIDDPASILDEEKGYSKNYLLILNDKRILISEKSCFCEIGNQFSAFRPTNVNGDVYHMSGSVPRDKIKYVVKLEELGGLIR